MPGAACMRLIAGGRAAQDASRLQGLPAEKRRAACRARDKRTLTNTKHITIMADFIYQEPFPVGEDKTQYRLLTKDYVKVVECDGRKILKVDPAGLELLSKAAYSDVSFYLRAAHLQKLRNILDDPEATDNDKFVAYTMLLNQVVAAEGELPTCQDTGTAICIGHKGEDVYTGADDAEHIARGVYETYKDDEFVTPLVTQISWTNHLLIMSGSKTPDERHFYMALCAKEHYSKRELERQIGTSYYERSMISAKKPMPESVSHDVRESILDTYVLEFLDLPEQFSEKNLRKAIIENLKQFILEFGRDFTFIGEEYRVQVGNTDFFIDLLFYNRALSCLVPIELKIGKFKPEHIGQINFYLEALDRDVKKPNENPSVGVILCASKDDAVVEYALSRSMSPTLVADYRLCLPDKTLLQNKLRELTELALESSEGNEGDEE